MCYTRIFRYFCSFFALSLIFLVISCTSKDGDDNKEVTRDKMVKSIHVGGERAVRYRSFPGRVDAIKKVDLAFQVSGPLIELPVANGQEVTIKQLLARIDPRDYKNALAEAQAKFEKAERDERRYLELVKKGAVAKIDYDEKKAQRDITAARLETAKKALDDTFMYAPFSGVIAQTYVENHENVLAKQKILSLHDVTSVEIIVDLPERDLFYSREEKIETGANSPVVAYATFEALPGELFDLQLKEYTTDANSKTQTYQIKLFMVTPEKLNILPGMTATVLVDPEEATEKIFDVPVSAVVVDEHDHAYVWVINEDMTVRRQDVDVGSMNDRTIEVIKGLHKGDRIVTAGAAFLHDGDKVRLLENSKDWKVRAQ